MSHGVTLEKLQAIEQFRESPLYSEVERAALEYAEAVTTRSAKIPEELYARLSRHFTSAQLVELTATIALENFRARFNTALGIEAQGVCG